MNSALRPIIAGVAMLFFTPWLNAQGTAFSYQGSLRDGGSPANGLYDFHFAIYDAITEGNPISRIVTNSATLVTNGRFKVQLDFGGVFNETNCWLEIALRTNSISDFITLDPRQLLMPVPKAYYAVNAGSASSVLAGNIVGAVPMALLPASLLTNTQKSVLLQGTFGGDGSGLSNLYAANLTGTIVDSQLSSNIARLSIPNTTTPAIGGVTVTAGFITGATITDGGSGYTTAPTVKVQDPRGSNAVIIASVSNSAVVGLTIQNAGNNYSAGATLMIALPPSNAYQVFSSGNVFEGVNAFSNTNNMFAGLFLGSAIGSFSGNGGGLTNLNAACLKGTASSLSAGLLTISSNLYLPSTTPTGGTIYSGGNTLMHAFGDRNFFAGPRAGNFTLTGAQCVGVGTGALEKNTSGYENTAIGLSALGATTSGSQNTADGAYCLNHNTTGNRNTAIGQGALSYNETGNDNTATGFYALVSNTSGIENTAAGIYALERNTVGNYNTANGVSALRSNQTGNDNTAVGWDTLYFNQTGCQNTASGREALSQNSSGHNNTAMGWKALWQNKTNNNTAIGAQALLSNDFGINNMASGAWALYGNTVGSRNTADGCEALRSNTIGSNNIALGYQAGMNLISGSSNIIIGNLGLSSDTNVIRIGTTQSKAMIAGIITGNGSGLTNIHAGQLTAGVVPDARLSTNVAMLVAGNSFSGTNIFTGEVAATNMSNVFSGSFSGGFAGDGSSLTNLSPDSVTGGLTTNVAVLVPGGETNILCFTNGILRAIQ